MAVYRIFQAAFLIGMIITMIFDAREMIVHDKSLRWTHLLLLAVIGMFFLEFQVQRKQRKLDQKDL